jgi:Tol biopolymer transport system component
MKAKIIALFMIMSMLFAVASFAQEIDPGTGVQIWDKAFGPVIWSPDGKYRARAIVDGIYFSSTEGGNEVKIYSYPISSSEVQYPCFSPDGKEIFFSQTYVDTTKGSSLVTLPSGGSYYTNLVPRIKAVNVETKAVRTVRDEAFCPRFSRDGRYFVYGNYDHRAFTDPANAEHHLTIAIFDTVTEETRYIAEGLGVSSNFSFSGDGKYIAFNDNTGKIFTISFDGSQVEQISLPEYSGLNPSGLPECSPDGRWIMYTVLLSNNPQRMQLFAYNTETKETKSVFPTGTVMSFWGVWHPDGKKFDCFLRIITENGTVLDEGTYTYDFVEQNLGVEPVLASVPHYIPRAFGTAVAKIDQSAELQKAQYDSKWSPDGKWIAMASWDAIWIVPSEGGIPIKVMDAERSLWYNGYDLRNSGPPFIKGFTSDSKEILFRSSIIDESRGTKVELTIVDGHVTGSSITGLISIMKAVNIFTGETRIVMDPAYECIYSHNGKYLVYQPSSNSSVNGIYLYDIETKQSRKLTESGLPFCFSYDDSFILATVNNCLTKIPLDGGAAESLDIYSVFKAIVTPDSRFILYSKTFNNISRIALYDTATKKSNFILPETSDFRAQLGALSDDGKKFCYQLQSSLGWEHVYVRDINPAEYTTVTAVETGKPLEFSLQGNYPNPFNPSTTIQFTLASSGKVNLVIYNVAGQKVRELVKDAEMTPGIHNVLWNGHNDLGVPVSSGIYLTRLQMGGKSLAGRMLLMK